MHPSLLHFFKALGCIFVRCSWRSTVAEKYQRLHHASSTVPGIYESSNFLDHLITFNWLKCLWSKNIIYCQRFSGSVCREMAVVADGLGRWEQLSMDIKLQLKHQQDSLENLWKKELQSFARGEGGMTYLEKILRSRLLMVKMFGYQGFGFF